MMWYGPERYLVELQDSGVLGSWDTDLPKQVFRLLLVSLTACTVSWLLLRPGPNTCPVSGWGGMLPLHAMVGPQ